MPNVIIITGTSSGLGLQLAEHYCNQNNRVIGLSRRESPLQHPAYRHFTADVTDFSRLTEIAALVLKEYSKVDLLVNNASLLTSLPFALMKPEDAKAMIDVNITGTIFSCRAFLRGMIQAGGAAIVNVISMSHRVGVPGDSVYAATKSAIEVFSHILNKECSRQNVRVNCLGISAFDSGMLAKVAGSNPDKITKHIPHGRLTTLAEVVHSINFLASPLSTDVGGQSLYLGGC